MRPSQASASRPARPSRSIVVVARWVARLGVAVLLAVALAYLPYRAYGPRGLGRAQRLERELQELVARQRRIAAENQQLRATVQALRDGREVIERAARDELGLVRADDLVWQFE